MSTRRELEQALAAWAAIPVNYETGGLLINKTLPYCICQLNPGVPENPVFGSGYREIGNFRVWLRYPRDAGLNAINDAAESLIFYFKRANYFNGVTILFTPQLSGVTQLDDCIELLVTIPYSVDKFTG
jgi:hypothetical protein